MQSVCGRCPELRAQGPLYLQREESTLTFPRQHVPACASLSDHGRTPAPTEMHP